MSEDGQLGRGSTGGTMNRENLLSILRAHKAALAQRFGVVELRLYGSFARDQAADDSDVDVLVRFDASPDWKRYFGAQAYLEDLLGRPVDMATNQELRTEIRPYVERELIDV